jgi:hypothetical protein
VRRLRWQDRKAPGGVWVDTCSLAPDGLSYAGRNQIKGRVSGSLVKAAPKKTAENARPTQPETKTTIRTGSPQVAALAQDAMQLALLREKAKVHELHIRDGVAASLTDFVGITAVGFQGHRTTKIWGLHEPAFLGKRRGQAAVRSSQRDGAGFPL